MSEVDPITGNPAIANEPTTRIDVAGGWLRGAPTVMIHLGADLVLPLPIADARAFAQAITEIADAVEAAEAPHE